MCQRTQPYTFVFCSLFANNAGNKKQQKLNKNPSQGKKRDIFHALSSN